MKISEKSPCKLGDTIKRNKLYIIRVPEENGGRNGEKVYLKKKWQTAPQICGVIWTSKSPPIWTQKDFLQDTL